MENENTKLKPQDFFDARAERNAVQNGTIQADRIENAQRINIPDAPVPEKAERFIDETPVPTEFQATEDVQRADSGAMDKDELSKLSEAISQRSDIFNELGMSDIRDSVMKLQERSRVTSELEDQFGVGQKSQAVTDIQNQIAKTDNRFTRERERIQDQPGLTSAQKNARLNDVTRKQSRELADLSIIQSARINDLNTTQALVDRKVELEFEPIEQALEFQKFVFEENKDLFNTEEERQFNSKLRKEQEQVAKDKFKFQQFETLKANYMQNAAEAGKSNEYLQSINSAQDQESLMGISGIQNYSLSTADKLANELKSVSIGTELARQNKLSIETDILENPENYINEDTDSRAIELVNDLTDKQRTTIAQANTTKSKIEEMKNIISNNDRLEWSTTTTEAGRRFSQLSADVVDLLARERTGAVVGKDEEKTFRKIVGVGTFNKIAADDDEILRGLNDMLGIHNQALTLSDPTGEISSFLQASQNTSNQDIDAYADKVDGLLEKDTLYEGLNV